LRVVESATPISKPKRGENQPKHFATQTFPGQ
jgi:hypothetical protein